MKKLSVLFIVFICLWACAKTEEQKKQEEMDKKAQEILKDYAKDDKKDKQVNGEKQEDSEEKMTINIADYNFVIPEDYDSDLKKNSQLSKQVIEEEKTITIKNTPLSIIFLNARYYDSEEILYFAGYLINNTDRTIDSLSFQLNMDFEKLGGQEINKKFLFNTEENENHPIPPKTIMPAFFAVTDMKINGAKKVYSAEELPPGDLSNIILHYGDE